MLFTDNLKEFYYIKENGSYAILGCKIASKHPMCSFKVILAI